jgi:CBS domain-containing protein
MTISTVADVMTRAVVMAGVMTPQPEIVALLARLEISGVPVVDELGHPLGFVSERELLGRQRSMATQSIGVRLDWMPPPEQRDPSTLVAAQLMSAPHQTVTLQTPLQEAARLLLATDHRRLLVVDGVGRLIGIVTRRDLRRALLTPGHGAGGVDVPREPAQERDARPVAEPSLA